MIILGLDTALKACSAALWREGAVIVSKSLDIFKGHAEHLAPMVASLFEDAGAPPQAVDRIGVVTGPGGFAGVRVGLAFARGFALGDGPLVIGVNSLAALAAGAPARTTAVLVDARRGQVYGGLYGSDGAEIIAPFLADAADARDRLMRACRQSALGPPQRVGDGWAALGEGSAAEVVKIDPGLVACLAAGAPPPAFPPAPLYLRPPDAAPPRPPVFAPPRSVHDDPS